MSLLNKKVHQFNSSNNKDSIIIPKNDFIINKNYLMKIEMKNNELSKGLKGNNRKKEITNNKLKSKKMNKNKIKKDYVNNKNLKINDNKKSKKIEFCFFIKKTDTLKIKNNNFKSFLNNYRYKLHSFEDLKNSKKNLDYFSISNNSTKNENKNNNIDKSKNINLLLATRKTNDLCISKEKDTFKSNKKIINEHNIKTFNQFFVPKFINEKSNKLINNLNLTQSRLKNKILIEKKYHKNILHYRTHSKNNNNNHHFLNSSKSYKTFNNHRINFSSKNFSSRNSLIVLNEDDIETLKKGDNSFNSIQNIPSLGNFIKIPERDIHYFETPKQTTYDYIQSPIEFQYESDIISSKNTINNEIDINQVCSNLKNIKLHEIQKKNTNIENDTIKNYDQMEEEELNSSFFFNRKINQTDYLSRSLNIGSKINNYKQIKFKIEPIKKLSRFFKRTSTDINHYKESKNWLDRIKENKVKQITSILKKDGSYIKNIANLIIKKYLDKNKSNFINKLKDLYKRNLNNKPNTTQNKKNNILKNKTSYKSRNINFIEIEEGEYIIYNKSYKLKNNTFFYFKNIFSKSNSLNPFKKIKIDRNIINKSFIEDMDKIKIKKELIFSNKHFMQTLTKNKKISKNLIKSDLTERTTDSKSLKINSFGENENDLINEMY